MSNLETRLQRLERSQAAQPCRHPEHKRWLVLENDEPAPLCPGCGQPPMIHRIYLVGVSLEDL